VLSVERGKGAEERDGRDGGATNGRGSPSDGGPPMDKLYTLLSVLRQPRDGTASGHHVSTRVLGIHIFTTGRTFDDLNIPRGRWAEYRHAPLGRCQMFCQSIEDVSLASGCIY
jgi:hypothetical protein